MVPDLQLPLQPTSFLDGRTLPVRFPSRDEVLLTMVLDKSDLAKGLSYDDLKLGMALLHPGDDGYVDVLHVVDENGVDEVVLALLVLQQTSQHIHAVPQPVHEDW